MSQHEVTSSPRYLLPIIGSNNPGGFVSSNSNSSALLPSINCGSEIVYQALHNDHSSKPATRIKLQDENDHIINDIRLVHGYHQALFLVSGDGKLYEISQETNTLKRLLIAKNENLEVLQIASYTEAVLFLVRDKVNDHYFIHGKGNNGYFRMSHKLQNVHIAHNIELMFNPTNELPNIELPYVINHIGCCYSYSCCIVNETMVHCTGQNWFNNGKTHDDGYLTWPIQIQDLKKPVTKLECGDFHVVALLKDGKVAVGGSNSSNQLGTSHSNSANAVSLPFNFIFSKISNIFSGSNTVVYQLQRGIGFYCYGSKSFDFINHGKVKKGLASHGSEIILEQQYTRDIFLHRYEDSPAKIFLDGSSYYGSDTLNNTEISLENLMPFEEFNKGVYPPYRKSEFYKNIKLVLQPKGLFCICDYGRGLASKMFSQLLKSTDYSFENNRLLLDIVIHAQQ